VQVLIPGPSGHNSTVQRSGKKEFRRQEAGNRKKGKKRFNGWKNIKKPGAAPRVKNDYEYSGLQFKKKDTINEPTLCLSHNLMV
jgi:hypothetical protein